MRSYDSKYHECMYCGKGKYFDENTHRIYIRSKQKDRKFIAIAWYCTYCKMFQTDDTSDKAHEREFRLEYNLKPEDSYSDKLNDVARMMGISV